MRHVLWIAMVLAVAAVIIGLSWYYLADLSPPREGFLVVDFAGDRMEIQVDPGRQEAFDALMEMHVTGESKWVGGEIEGFDNEFGFRFKPDTIDVAEVTAEGAQAVTYGAIQADFEYWRAFGVVFIEGNVAAIPA